LKQRSLSCNRGTIADLKGSCGFFDSSPNAHKNKNNNNSTNNLLTPWCRVLLQKLTGLQLVKKFPAFHGTRRFITALTGFRHLSLSRARPIQSIYPHTYLLTPWCRVLLEKLTRLQPVKKFPTFHRTRRFITALTSVHHLSLSWASPIQFMPPHPISRISILISSSLLRLGLPSGSFPQVSPTKTLYTPLLSLYRLHAPPIPFSSILPPEQYLVKSADP